MRPVLLVIMDGVGYREDSFGNAPMLAKTPNLDYLWKNYPHTLIHAHGTYVGLPTDEDMGNSEVGHNALGCGQIYHQGASLVNDAISSNRLFESNTWKELIDFCKNDKLHFIGLLSDGNVHSNISHLLKMLEASKNDGVREVCVHVLLDGRDVPPTSALDYIETLEKKMTELNDDNFNSYIASGGGRMVITMDRYEADWMMVKKGWDTHVLGKARMFNSAQEAITAMRDENPGIQDQNLPPFVIAKNNQPVGTINDGDSVLFYNFRGDRALEISRCFDEDDFNKFDKEKNPHVYYAGMLEYDADKKIPKKFLTSPPHITNTLTEELCKYGIREYAISETQKFGHVTYFWNGNRGEKFNEELETYDLIPSKLVPFEEQPEMMADEITDTLIENILSNKYDFLRVNYPNGDMIGHTGRLDKAIIGMEAVDRNLGRLMDVINKVNGMMIVLADHGNSEVMYQDKDKEKMIPNTSHTTNPVPFILYGNDYNNYLIKNGDYGLSNVASSIMTLLDLPKSEVWNESIIEKK